MNSWLFTLWMVVVIQRIVELRLAKVNDDWIKRQGGYEVGKEHYPWIIGLHILFFMGIWLESYYFEARPPTWWWIPFGLFLLAQALKWICIRTLGKYWSTRIWVIADHPLQRNGPYRYLRHPNYIAVIGELLFFPLVFGAYLTAFVATVANLYLLLFVRIPQEEKALAARR